MQQKGAPARFGLEILFPGSSLKSVFMIVLSVYMHGYIHIIYTYIHTYRKKDTLIDK